MKRHEETREENQYCNPIETTDTLLSNNTNVEETDTDKIPTQTSLMEKNRRIEVRRTVMTPRGRSFPPRKAVTLNLGQMAGTLFEALQEHVMVGFPGLQGGFILLHKGPDGEFQPCTNETDLLKVVSETHDDPLPLYAQGLCNWQKQHEHATPMQCCGCNVDIEGMRLGCLECNDYYLCPQCDEQGIHDDHVMVKCDRPRFFKHAIPHFAGHIPTLCKEVRGDCRSKMPRLEARELRQLWQKAKMQADTDRQCNVRMKQNGCFPREISCSNCTQPIREMRIKCLECEDFNLCLHCDDQGVHDNHVMAKSDRPRFFNVALPSFVNAIPKMCEEIRATEPGHKMSRVTPMQVRQFWKKTMKRHDMIEDGQIGAKRKTSAVVQQAGRSKADAGFRQEVPCNNCTKPISGMRAKCLECEDFNLCPQCAEQNIHDHHVMVKCDRPRFFNWGLPFFESAIPKLCQEVRDSENRPKMPRLEAKDVRQFWQKNRKQHIFDGEARGKIQQCQRYECKGNDWPHQELACTNCTKPVTAMRVKCLECDEYNLCPQCDEQGIHDHHVMVKCDRPRFFTYALKNIADVLPRFCEEQKKCFPDGPIPRLERQTVIHYWKENKTCIAEERPKYWQRRHHIRAMWHKFLSDIAAETFDDGNSEIFSRSCGDDELGIVAVTPDQDEHADNEQIADISQVRRQWMQKCLPQWKQQLQLMDPDNDKKRGLFQLWRSYMRGCWNAWKEQLSESGIRVSHQESQEKNPNEEGNIGCHPRRAWIENSWRLWCQQAAEKRNQWISDDVPNLEGQKRTKMCCTNGGLVPGYHFLMKKSWDLMTRTGIYTKKPDDGLMDDDECIIPPAQAKQMMKRCWVDGCRELWWMQVREQLTMKEEDVARDDEVTQSDIMGVMSQRPVWMVYMRQYWRLWHILGRKAGIVPGSKETKRSDDDPSNARTLQNESRQEWMKNCWTEWNKEMSKATNDQDGSTASKTNKPMWDKRPFYGWHPLVLRSWKIMHGNNDDNAKGAKSELMQSIKQAWVKEIQSQMKQLSFVEKREANGDDTSDSPVVQRQEHDPRWFRFTELEHKLMEQYWQLWRMQKQLVEKMEASDKYKHRSCRGQQIRSFCNKEQTGQHEGDDSDISVDLVPDE